MPSAPASSSIACVGGPMAALDTDLLVVPWFQDEAATEVPGLDSATAGDAASAAAARGRILGECSNLARELANEPGNTLTPREFARRAAAIASEAGVAVEILDETKIADLGMGLLLGVARGSSEPPRLLVFR